MPEPRLIPKSPLSVEAWIEEQCVDLLRGVEVAPEVFAAALLLVREDSAARRRLVELHPERSADQVEMIASRDAAVRALLATPEQRARLDENVARWKQEQSGEDLPPTRSA